MTSQRLLNMRIEVLYLPPKKKQKNKLYPQKQRRGNDFFIGWASKGVDGTRRGGAKRRSAEGGGAWGGAL